MAAEESDIKSQLAETKHTPKWLRVFVRLFSSPEQVEARAITILNGIDNLVLTPLRLVQVFFQRGFDRLFSTSSTHHGLASSIAFGVAGVSAGLFLLVNIAEELLDKRYRSYRTIGKALLVGLREGNKTLAPADIDKLSRKEFDAKLAAYLQADDNKAKLKQLNMSLFSEQYDILFDARNRLILKKNPAPAKAEDSDSTTSKEHSISFLKKLWLATEIVFSTLWNFLGTYAFFYWVVFFIAAISSSLIPIAGIPIAFSLAIAFGIPAIVPGIALLAKGIRALRNYFRRVPIVKEKEDEKAAKIQLLKVFWLQEKHTQEALARIEKLKSSENNDWSALKKHLQIAEEPEPIAPEIKLEENTINTDKALIKAELEQKHSKSFFFKGVMSFAGGYLLGVFALWPITDILTITGLIIPGTQIALIVTIAAFVLPFIFAGIQSWYSVKAAKQAYAGHEDKLKTEAVTLAQIDKLIQQVQAEKALHKEIQKLINACNLGIANLNNQLGSTEEPLASLKSNDWLPIPSMPQHAGEDCFKQMDAEYASWDKLLQGLKIVLIAIGAMGTGAFLVRSVTLMGVVPLFINPLTSPGFMLAVGVVCAVAAVSFAGIKIYEYYHNKDRKNAVDYLQEVNLRKACLENEIKVLQALRPTLEVNKAKLVQVHKSLQEKRLLGPLPSYKRQLFEEFRKRFNKLPTANVTETQAVSTPNNKIEGR